ncbi:Hsp20/alpha crystallin family protein [Leptospira mayottensis]|uniref:Spore protein SP21 family protein n=2 Tax=Leptospira mayottensis TaxID=1137606 RepID=A0AA87SZJ8_9LEPT|nr:Hsp20/alpha crystallin family protein [Leptospira mayottensis]AXR61736.1 Hsp20/alpha crystallin family protein [Leptospira mayottensis]AXR64966.1 Hsp20/alpha crystallin family protein [Leptospira mayottensis]AZQ01815.1 Hsp20/alpha crystallin family protein [Leptospira mayottensis 200901116]EKS00877.1 spore protein SP21 family protein [Leptospira mayottensis 200901122]TGN13245.1 Hsp20/alpha crystallin family protein [Leptospira mayottensis]
MNEFRIFEDLHKLQNQFSGLWDPFLLHGGSAYPALNIHKGVDAVTVTALIPGIEPENLEITISGNQLHFNGESAPKSTQGVNRAERFHGKFHRTLELPTEVDSEKANAEFKNGVLVLTLPIRESVKPRKIQIQTK